MPLSDWREGSAHTDLLAGTASAYDPQYLSQNIMGGEGYDWYYVTSEDRDQQLRTQISDTTHGENWIFRYKDLQGWWENQHHDRPGGVRNAQSTAWQPGSKPIVFTELGCAAIDKAANQPNVFLDPKSAESTLPYYSDGVRDDLIQRRFLEAHLGFWQQPENNPVSSVYGGPMLDQDRIYLYAWDARPFPDFPARPDVWADAGNWTTGHWLNGRAGRLPLDRLVQEVAAESGLAATDVSHLNGLVTGYVIDRPMSGRAALEPLAGLYQFDAVERGGVLAFVPRGDAPAITIGRDDLVLNVQDYTLNRAQAEDLPARLDLTYSDEMSDYQPGVVEATLPATVSDRVVTLDVPAVMEPGEAQGRAKSLIADALVMRTTAEFALPPSYLALEPSDVIRLQTLEVEQEFRLTSILDGESRGISAVATSPQIYDWQYTTITR